MTAKPDQPSEPPSASRMLMSVPWIVVILGVGLLAGLLVVALLAMRGEERQAVSAAVDPPMYLPTIGVERTAVPTDTASPLVTETASATPSASASPSPEASAARSAPAVTRSTGPGAGGTVTARYQVTSSDRNWFEARLTVTNGSDREQRWTVKLYFTGNVKNMEASSASGVSVSTEGSGVFVLRGTGALGAGQSATVQLRFSRTGTGDRPGQCTVNGANCVIG